MSLSSLSLWARHTPHSPCVTSRAAQFTEPAFIHLREPKDKTFRITLFYRSRLGNHRQKKANYCDQGVTDFKLQVYA